MIFRFAPVFVSVIVAVFVLTAVAASAETDSDTSSRPAGNSRLARASGLPVVTAAFPAISSSGEERRSAERAGRVRPSPSFSLEVARTQAERDRGLMFREELASDHGMLFVFDDDRPRSFWMKNTVIALDMIFVDSSGVVVAVIENAAPMTLVERRSERPARYVIELNAFKAAQSGIVPGSVVVFKPLPGSLQTGSMRGTFD